jgi:AraC-like DNA-binding protein
MRIWQTIRKAVLGRHVHKHAYAALVLSGCYEEAGDSGRHRVEVGDVILHEAFEAHLDRFSVSGAEILNLSLPAKYAFRSGAARIDDPDAIVRLAEKSDVEAAALLLSLTEIREPEFQDWPDQLAASLAQNPSLSLSRWSEAKGISGWDLSRGFGKVFGIPPCAFRARARTHQAWRAIRTTDAPLADIAAQFGFADQAHMTRSVKNLTGKCPGAWRLVCK